MDFSLTEEQKQILALIKDFCKREVDLKQLDEIADKAAVARTVQEIRANYPYDLIEKLHATGLRQLCVPEKYGGGGLLHDGGAYVTRALGAEQLGYSMGVAARLVVMPWLHCANHAGGIATEEQQDWFFTQFMENHTLMTAMSASEPPGATDIHLPYDNPPGSTVRVVAHKDGNEWVINGDKMFSSNSPVAELISVTTRTNKTAHISEAITNFWVRKDTPGLSYTINRLLAGELGGNAQLNFDNVRVPESQLIGVVNRRRNGGPVIIRGGFATKEALYADVLGHAQRIYDQVAAYAKDRTQGGRPIIQHPNIAAMLGEAAVSLEATRAFVYRAAWEHDQEVKEGRQTNSFWCGHAVFYQVKKMALRLCEIAYDVYGGIGGSVDLDLGRFIRRVYTWYPPGETANMNIIECSTGYNSHLLACQDYPEGRVTVPIGY